MAMEADFDVAIIGASFSGCSAALFLSNAMRTVALIDAGTPRNDGSTLMLNVSGADTQSPQQYFDSVNQELESFDTLERISANVERIDKQQDDYFLVHFVSPGSQLSHTLSARRLVLATGVHDVLPEIAGIDPFWPENVFHCPYCVAHTLINQPLAIKAIPGEVLMMAKIIHKWTDDLIVITDANTDIADADKAWLSAHQIPLIESNIDKLTGEPGKFVEIHLSNGQTVERRGVFMHLPYCLNAPELLDQLGVLYEDECVAVNEQFVTNVPGVYAIGDMVTELQKIAHATYSGTAAGFFVDHELSLSLVDQ